MPKNTKKARNNKKAPKHAHRPTLPPKPSSKPKPKFPPTQHHHQQPPPRRPPPTIPFDPTHSILLISEGDFSFAYSLLTHHSCGDLTATAHEGSHAEVVAKYPAAEAHIAALVEGEGEEEEEEAGGRGRVVYGVDVLRGQWGRRLLLLLKGKKRKEGNKGKGDERTQGQTEGSTTEGWDRIVFNFPHVGGKSTDVNRQVRYNQELLVGFFTSVIPLLNAGGWILVTLFEGEPYTLWNIRDLARHSGLMLLRSFAFRAEAYPGYRHARTLGTVTTGGGGWRGEEREARTFVFGLKDDAGDGRRDDVVGKGTKRKRKRGESSSDEEDD
ncbi:MAG: hypothetical protein M1816_005224 [Peltula sp. TS41687]|nr:MAG: hypothetical protein M1816_005224 [Peltula sp. TS41687]